MRNCHYLILALIIRRELYHRITALSVSLQYIKHAADQNDAFPSIGQSINRLQNCIVIPLYLYFGQIVPTIQSWTKQFGNLGLSSNIILLRVKDYSCMPNFNKDYLSYLSSDDEQALLNGITYMYVTK